MKSFSIFPHKGYLNTDFQIRVLDDKSHTFYYDNSIAVKNADSFRLPAGIHRIKSDISGEEFDEVEVEDAIRLGGSKVEAGYCFDNSPWAVAVMKDRTYFLNSNTGNQYLENGLSPLSVSALSERLLLFTYGTIDESGIAKIVEYSVFDVTQGVSIGRFDNYILHNTEISVFSDAPTDDGICLHVMRYSEVSVIIDIPCKTYTIFDGMIYYCAISDDKFMVMRLQSDGTQEGIQYCSGPQSEFVGFVMNHYYVRRSGKYFYLKDFITVSNYIGESIHNHGGVIREINGVNVQKTDLVDDFYKLVVNNKDVCSRLDLHTQIIDVTLYETSEGIYEKAICHNYSWLDYNYKRPSVSCELNILGCGDSISIDRYDSIYCADNFIILNKLDTIRIIQHGKCVRELTNVTLRSTPNGMYIYVNENDEIRSVYKVGALSDELIVQGCKENIHLSFVEKYGILTENSKHYRIYNIDNDKWENLPHQKYLLMEKIGKCFLQDTDDDGQGYFLQYNYIPVTLPIRVSDILSITTNGSLIMSQSPRGIIVHERFLGSVPYRINEKLCEVIDTDEYRNALFSDDGSHTIYNKNGTWYYYDISTGSELEFEMEPEISKRQIHGLYCMNFYTRFNDTDRRIGLVDPISLQIVPPVYIDDYVFVSPSGKLASKTHIAGVKIRYFLTNSDRRTKDIVLRREVTDILNKTELMLLESNIRHLEFAFPGSQKEDWEKEMITSLVNRIGREETPSDRYCLYARKDALIDIFSTEKEDKVIQIELPLNLGYLNSIIFGNYILVDSK